MYVWYMCSRWCTPDFCVVTIDIWVLSLHVRNRYQMSAARRWQPASRRSLLKIACFVRDPKRRKSLGRPPCSQHDLWPVMNPPSLRFRSRIRCFPYDEFRNIFSALEYLLPNYLYSDSAAYNLKPVFACNWRRRIYFLRQKRVVILFVALMFIGPCIILIVE
jgi:hypothetical protein